MNKWDLLFKKCVKYKPLNDLFLGKLLYRLKEITPQLKNVIDLGCGSGESLLKFYKNDFIVTGIDSSIVAIEKAHGLFKKENLNFIFSVGDLEEITKTINGKFDIIFSKDTYAFIKDKQNFLESVNGLMHTESIFVLITPVLYNGIKYSKEDKPGIATDFNETKNILSKNFDSVEIFHHDYFGNKGDIATFLVTKKR